ncbi:hypothetical protein DIPPA_32307 [Diplonema papillatum]|nr:ATP synthase mitochondrial F1 complex assembly factor 2 [Diplonema papillatum]KAJ9439214.1 ATP synthase mitochondrial F1 complex assembly factor 2 [Diplonema papillatum]KAJ9449875.1 hypothetical protein DIPPA_32307 [Diplonema papillatum]
MHRPTLARVSRWYCTGGPAKKRGTVGVDGGMFGNVRDVEVPRTSAEGTQTKYTMDDLEAKLHQQAAQLENLESGNLDPEHPQASEVLQQSYAKYREASAQQERIADQDGLFNMSPSGIKAEPIRAAKVFYKTVDVIEVQEGKWWAVTLDGRRAAAFESEDNLLLPTEEFALAVAHEWAAQTTVINRFSMPLTDVTSGAHQVKPDGVATRLAYLLEFFRHDHMFHREDTVRAEQTEMIDPILAWADRFFDITTPRVEGIRRPAVDAGDVDKLRIGLERLELNKYQLVCLTVLCQYMSSLVLPLAVLHGACTLQRALEINRIEEAYNIRTTAAVEGYHDIRYQDSTVKMAACYTAYVLTKNIAAHDCYPDPALLTKRKPGSA